MAFPTTPILSSFPGGDESPLSEGGLWQPNPFQVGLPRPNLTSNQAVSNGGDAEAVWAEAFGHDQEVYATLTSLPAAGQGIALWLGLVNENTTSADGYGSVVTGDASNNLLLIKMTNQSVAALGSLFTVSDAVGHKLGCCRRGDEIELWYDDGGGWDLINSETDTDFTGTARLGIELNSGATAIDDFGGGDVVVGGGLAWIVA